MPIYMDIHEVPGVEALHAAEAHSKDLLIQHEYQCKCMTYWIDELRGTVFCLIEAPDESVVEKLHRRSHGLIPHKIIVVNNDVVQSFLGRISDPSDATITDNGLKVFHEAAFRILLVTDHTDLILLRHFLGAERANEMLSIQNNIIRKELSTYGGREVEYPGKGFIASFTSAGKAVECALSIHKKIPAADKRGTGFKISINAGDPVSKSDKLFGDAIQLGRNLCDITTGDKVVIASIVKELLPRHFFQSEQNNISMPLPQHETLVQTLFNCFEKNWQNPDFDANELCQGMSMSKSQLYRKTIALWGLAPNQLLKEFRLEKARELLRTQTYNISQTTFDSGFTSPSYFTKCFKKKYGLLPANYISYAGI